MRRSLVLLSALAAAFICSGCIRLNMDTQLAADGSGTFLMSYGMSPSVAQAMQELAELGTMDGMQGEMPTLMDMDKAQLEAMCKKHGVKLKTFEEKEAEGAKRVTLELAFPNLEAFNAVMQSSVTDGGGGMRIFKTADGNYLLKGVEENVSTEEDEDEAEAETETGSEGMKEFDPEAMGKSMEIMGKLMSSINELDVSMRITVPGDILESTAMRTEGRTAIWEINGQNMMTAGSDMGEPEVTFSGKGLSLDAPMLDN